MGVEEKIPHEGYNQKNKNRANDIGLIRLNGEVTYTDYIRPICLPASVNSRRAHVNEKLVSAGWGRTLTSENHSFIFYFIFSFRNFNIIESYSFFHIWNLHLVDEPENVINHWSRNEFKMVSPFVPPFLFSLAQKSATKQEIRLPLVDHAACASKYGVLGIHVSDNQLCAGGNYGEDTCDGDSGNALVSTTITKTQYPIQRIHDDSI